MSRSLASLPADEAAGLWPGVVARLADQGAALAAFLAECADPALAAFLRAYRDADPTGLYAHSADDVETMREAAESLVEYACVLRDEALGEIDAIGQPLERRDD